jgi:TPR repeat protein
VYSLYGSSLEGFSSAAWVARKAKQYGLYESKKQAWVIDCTQGKITAFAKNVLGVARSTPANEAGLWVHNASTGAALVGPYESLTDCAGTLNFAAVLGFTQTEVFTIGQTGIVKPLTSTQADSLMMMIPSNDVGEFYMTKAQGKLVVQYFSSGLKTAELIETAFDLEQRNEYKQSLEIYLQIINQIDAKTKDKSLLNTLGVAYVNAGYIYASQSELENINLACEYYQKAIDLGEAQGMNNLGCFYRDGKGVAQNTTKAIALFEQAYKLNNMQAANNLGNIYYDTDLQDHPKALKYFLACYRDYPENLPIAWLYDNVLNDYTSALVYYQKAAKNGSGYAFNCIGEMWQQGLLGKSDVIKAQESYKKAMQAEQSSGDAGLNLAKLLIDTDKTAAKAAFDFALNHEDVVDGLTEFGRKQGWI